MDLDPETVKQEIEAVKVACDEVDARLRGRAQPTRSGGILSRVSKLSGQPAEPTGHRSLPSGPPVHQHDNRNNSRRFVNRNWNIARKRTAEGLFADDQPEDAVLEPPISQEQHDSDQNGYHPRKRLHRDEPNHRSQQGYPSDQGKPISSRISFQARDGHNGRHAGEQNGWRGERQGPGGEERYDPFEAQAHNGHPPSHHQRHHENKQHSGRGGDHHHLEYDRDPAAQPLRPYNREGGQLPRNGGNRHMHERPQHSMPSRRNRERPETHRGVRGQQARVKSEAPEDDSQKNAEQEEDGELPEDMPGPPEDFGRPEVPFVAEKRPEPKRAVTAADRGRNKRMLGAIMGHLHKAEKQERSFELSEVVQRRRELELHAEQRAKDEAFKARAAAREKAHEARRKDVAQKRELLLQQHMKQAKLLCAQKIHHARDLLKFIRTQTVPPILWKPARQNHDVFNIYQQQAQDFELWADKQAAKLQAEQHNMRERAEKQWADIDTVHEDRLQHRHSGPPPPPPGRGGRGREGSGRDQQGGREGANRGRDDRPEWQDRHAMPRRDAGGPIQLSTAQQAMLDREKKKSGSGSGGSGGGGVQPVQLTTAQQAMLDREKKKKEAAEGDAAADEKMDTQEDAQEDEDGHAEAVEGDVDEEERRQAEEDDAEALDEGYLLDDIALDGKDDEAGHESQHALEDDDATEDQAERFEAAALDHDHVDATQADVYIDATQPDVDASEAVDAEDDVDVDGGGRIELPEGDDGDGADEGRQEELLEQELNDLPATQAEVNDLHVNDLPATQAEGEGLEDNADV